MRKQLALGAGIALVFGAAAVGCSSSKSGGFFASLATVDLNNGDNAPMSAIATNNLAADGGGFSSGNQSFAKLQMKINKKATSSDGSAIVAFTTNDQLDGHERLFMSYYDASTFTPPIEVTGQDRDEFIGAGDITVGNILMIPLNTSGYKGAATTTSGDAGAVRANSGNWVIVWDATTYSSAGNSAQLAGFSSSGAGFGGGVASTPNSPVPPVNNSAQVAANQVSPTNNTGSSGVGFVDPGTRIRLNLQGPHRALYETLFVKSFANSPSTFSTILGTNTATSTTTTAASREYRYGFLVNAVQITTLKRGVETGFSSGSLGTFVGNPAVLPVADIVSPAESVQSYGFASDGLAGPASFSGSGTAFSGAAGVLNGGAAPITGSFFFVDQPHTFLANGVGNNGVVNVGTLIANPAPGTPTGASYAVGEDVSFVQLYWTQIVSSANSGDNTAVATPSLQLGDVGVHVGNRLAAFRAGLDLRTMTFDAVPSEITMASTQITSGSQPLKAAVSPVVGFQTYNQFCFMSFLDASIAQVSLANLSRNNGNGTSNNWTQSSSNASVREFNTALEVFTATDSLNGTSTVGSPTRINVVGLTTLSKDNLDNDKWSPSTLNTEKFGNQVETWMIPNLCIFGPDEGLGDTTFFFFEQHSSAAAVSGDANVDRELGAAVLAPNGSLQTPGKNPLIISQSVGENTDSFNVFSNVQLVVGHPNQGLLVQGTTNVTGPVGASQPASGSVFQDPVEGPTCCMNRSGTYVIVSYRQFMGTSSGSFSRGLNAVVMKTFRVAASNGGSSQVTSGAPDVGTRFTAPNRIDIVGTTGQTISGQPGTPAPSINQSGTTQLSTGAINMIYTVRNSILGLNAVSVFPTSTGVNSHTVAPCGYKCSFQSDASLVNFVWEQSDTSEDRVFVRQMKIDVTNATPVVTLGGSVGELESGNRVTGDAIVNLDAVGGPGNGSFNIVVRKDFDFIEGDAATLPTALDLGVDSAGKGGGLLLLYTKTTDATSNDGNFFNRAVIAVQWDGSSLSNRTEISRGIHEGGTNQVAPASFPTGNLTLSQFGGYPTSPFNVAANGAGPGTLSGGQPAVSAGAGGPSTPLTKNSLKTRLVGAVQVPLDNDIAANKSLSPKGTYIYFVTPNGDNADTAVGLYTRKFDHTIRATANNTKSFGDQFVPTAGTGPGSASFLQPTRMDHMTGGNVTGTSSINKDGSTATVLFWQDGHLWLSGTNDGVTYTQDGKGSANPFLVDNDTSASVQFVQVVNYSVACQDLHKSVVFFGKNDLSQTNGPNGNTGGQAGGNAHTGFYAFRLRLRTFN